MWVQITSSASSRSCQYRTIRDTYRIVYKKFHIVRTYRKWSWIVRYIGAYYMNCIVSVNRTIHRHVGLKWVFLLKFVTLFDLNKLLDFVNTKLLGNLIESNEIANPCIFSPILFHLQNLDYTHNTHFHMCKIIFYSINNVLNENIIFFYFVIIILSLKG